MCNARYDRMNTVAIRPLYKRPGQLIDSLCPGGVEERVQEYFDEIDVSAVLPAEVVVIDKYQDVFMTSSERRRLGVEQVKEAVEFLESIGLRPADNLTVLAYLQDTDPEEIVRVVGLQIIPASELNSGTDSEVGKAFKKLFDPWQEEYYNLLIEARGKPVAHKRKASFFGRSTLLKYVSGSRIIAIPG